MRKFARRSATLSILTLAMLVGCDTTEPKDGDGASPTGENASMQSTLTAAHPVPATIPGSEGSIDTFVVTLPVDSGRIYAVTIDNPVTDKLTAELIASNGGQLDFAMTTIDNRASDKGVRDSLSFMTTETDTLRFLIIGAGGTSILAKVSSESANGTTLRIFHADDHEFDDFDYRAGWIATDSTVQQRTLHTLCDVDWLRFLVVEGRTYEIHVRSDEAIASIRIDRAGTNNNPWWRDEKGYGGDDSYYYTLTYEATRTDTAKIEIWAYNQAHYTIAVKDTAGIEGDQIADSYEDDDAMSKAKFIPLDGNWQQRTIDPDDVSDWVYFTCDSTHTYTLETIGFRGIEVRAFSPDTVSLPITYSNSFEDWHTVYRAEFSSPHGGICYMELSANSSRSYKAALSSRSGVADSFRVDVFEPDDVPERAKYLSSDSSVQRRTFHKTEYTDPPQTNDVDWVRLEVDSGKTYSIHRTGASSITLYDGDTTRPLYIPETYASGSIRSLVYPAAKTTTLLLKVVAADWGLQAYTLAAVAHDGLEKKYVPDAYEADDVFGQAKNLPSDGSSQNHTIHLSAEGKNNVDVMYFDADSGRVYTIEAVSASPLNVLVLRSDSTLPLMELVSSDLTHTVTLPVTHGGRYYVTVKSSYGSSGVSYRVSLRSSGSLPSWAIPEPGEPDTGWGNATILLAGEPALPRFLAGDDTDWVRIPRTAGNSYKISVFDSAKFSEGGELRVNVLRASGAQLAWEDVSAGREWSEAFVATEDDTLLVRIGLYLTHTNKRLPYSIKVEATPVASPAPRVALPAQAAKLEEVP